MKYSILMPYYDRPGHLHNTLISFKHHYGCRVGHEVVIVEDAKNSADEKMHDSLMKVIHTFHRKIIIKHVIAEGVEGWNPSPLFNIAAKEADGDFLIITNPECFHKTNILIGLDGIFLKDEGVYVVCASESIKGNKHFIKDFDDLGGVHHTWYQHSKHRNRLYHFCSAMSKKTWEIVGGFDERYAHGIAYDDDDFKTTVLNKNIPVIVRDDLHTIHQWHKKIYAPPNRKHLVKRNHDLYEEKWKTKIAL